MAANRGVGWVAVGVSPAPPIDATPPIDACVSPDAPPLTSACNPVSQTGCEAGEKCALVLADRCTGVAHVACVPDGTQDLGEACTEPTEVGEADDCAAGGDCYRGTCHEICTTVNDQCVDGQCVTFQDSLGRPIPVEICLPNCDPLLQDCPAGEGCYFAGEPVCVGAGTTDLGEPCASANGCKPGAICVGSDMSGFFCRSLCGPWMDCVDDSNVPIACACGDTRACSASEVCIPIGDGIGGAAHDTAGVCIPATDEDCDCSADPVCP